MPNWAKVVTLIIGLGGYSATVIATLWQGDIPDIGTLGIPAALILALAPPVRIGRSRAVGTASGRRGVAAARDDDSDEGDSA